MDYSASQLNELISFLDGLPEPRIVMDADYRIVAANKAYRREYAGSGSGSVASILGRRCYEVSHHFTVPCDQAGESCPLKLSQEEGASRRVLHLHHTPRGEEHVDVETTPVRDQEGRIVYFVETLRMVQQASSRPAAQGLVGRSPAFQQMLEKVLRVAPAQATVLLLGETGTGKELVAQAVHEASGRRDSPFVAVDCTGLTENLFESELFGHEKGAFTGAAFRKLGLVESASGGTLFLDEIGELPPALQVKLLRLLETGTYRRVGGVDTLRADFRLVAATHRDLKEMVRQERFRRDLYYRLNTFPIHTPSLAERREDIPLLAASLLERVDHRPGRHFSAEALAWLAGRNWEGNIRELRNLIERATLMSDGEEIGAAKLAEVADDGGESKALAAGVGGGGDDSFRVPGPLPLAQLEQRYLTWLMARPGADVRTLAPALGVSERTLYRKLRR